MQSTALPSTLTNEVRYDLDKVLDILAISLLLIYWMAFITLSPTRLSTSIVDDSYIFQKVVDNLWEGRGWTYNPGTQVNPITSPFYAFVLLVAKAFGAQAPTTISACYIFGLIALGVGVYFGMRKSHDQVLSWLMAALVSSTFVLTNSWGMETSIFLACLVWAVLTFVNQQYLVSGLLCACAALSRPEGLALIGILAGTHWLKERRILWGMVGIFAVVLLPWLVFSWLAYGHILPNSVSVKAMQHDIGWFKTQPSWLRFFLSQPRVAWLTYPLAALGFYQAGRAYWRGDRFVALVILFGLVQASAYAIMNAPPGYLWYVAPGNLAVDMAVILGAFWLWQKGSPSLSRKVLAQLQKPLIGMLVFLVAMVGLSRLTISPVSLIKPYRLTTEYTLAGEWINNHTPAHYVVAATEIGYLGYFSKRAIRDIHGLIHPEALPSLKREEWDWWFKTKPPEIIVVHSPPWSGEPSDTAGWPAKSLEDFRTGYEKVASFGTVDIYQATKPASP